MAAGKTLMTIMVVLMIMVVAKPGESSITCCHNCYAKCTNGGSVDFSCLLQCFGTCGGCDLDPPPAGTELVSAVVPGAEMQREEPECRTDSDCSRTFCFDSIYVCYHGTCVCRPKSGI